MNSLRSLTVWIVCFAVGLAGFSSLLAADTAPVISSLTAPRQIVAAGGSLTLNVSASGATGFQWVRNGRPISGATDASLVISAAAPVKDNGWYQVRASNGAGTTLSRAVFVNVSGGYKVQAWGDPALTAVPDNLDDVVAISAGANHSLALKSDGTVVSWGSSGDPICGVVPSNLSEVVAIAAGWGFSLALKADGTVIAVQFGGLLAVPAGLSDVVSVAAGINHALALKSDGTVVAWGYNSAGQTSVPLGLTGVCSIAAGESFSVAAKTDGTVVMWPARGIESNLAIPSGLSDVASVSAGISNIIALKTDGTLKGWGDLGGNNFNSAPISSLVGIKSVAAGSLHGLFLKSDGTIFATDYGIGGQMVRPRHLHFWVTWWL